MHRRAFACFFVIAISSASAACPSKPPPESAANVAPSTSASTSSASPSPQPTSDEDRLQLAVYTYCSAYEQCAHQSDTPCRTAILQYIETGCAKSMLAYYDCAGTSTCVDGDLVAPAECNDASDAMNDCVSKKK